MGLQFQQFVNPQAGQDVLPRTIDDIFNAYYRAKQDSRAQGAYDVQQQQAQRANAAQDFQESAQYGKPLTKFSADERTEAQGAPSVQTPGMLARPGLGPIGQNGMVGTYSSPAVAQLHSAFQDYQAQRQAQLAAAGAGLAKTQAETRGANAKAGLDELQSALLGNGPMPSGQMPSGQGPAMIGQAPAIQAGQEGNIVQNVLNAVKNKQMSPSQADDWLGRNPLAHLAYVNAAAKSGLDLRALENDYQRSKATASYEGGNAVQGPTRLIESVKPILGDLSSLAEKLGFGDYPAINKAKLAYAKQKGDPNYTDYVARTEEARAQLAQIFQAGGSPTDVAQKRANEFMEAAPGRAQLERFVNITAPELLKARGDALGGKKDIHTGGRKQTKVGRFIVEG